MKLKLVVSLLAMFSLFGATAYAQETAPKLDVFAGYSYLQANPGVSGVDSFHLHGGSASVAYNVNRWLSGVADFGGYNNGNVLSTGVSARSLLSGRCSSAWGTPTRAHFVLPTHKMLSL